MKKKSKVWLHVNLVKKESVKNSKKQQKVLEPIKVINLGNGDTEINGISKITIKSECDVISIIKSAVFLK